MAFTSSFPGRILPMELTPGRAIVCQKRSFLVAERSVDLEVHLHRRLGSGLFGGEGFVLQRLSGTGTAFIEIDGSVVERELAPGQVLKVDPGHIAAFESGVDFSLDRVKGVKNILFGGEGLFLATLRGPGRIWLQTMPMANLVQTLLPLWPKSSKS